MIASRKSPQTLFLESLVGHSNSRTIPVLFIKILGNDHAAACVLSQLVYWQGKMDGEFYKPDETGEGSIGLCEECVVSVKQLTRIRKKLKLFGVIPTRKGIPARMHYRVDMEVLGQKILESLEEEDKSLPKGESGRSASQSERQGKSLPMVETDDKSTKGLLESLPKVETSAQPKVETNNKEHKITHKITTVEEKKEEEAFLYPRNEPPKPQLLNDPYAIARNLHGKDLWAFRICSQDPDAENAACKLITLELELWRSLVKLKTISKPNDVAFQLWTVDLLKQVNEYGLEGIKNAFYKTLRKRNLDEPYDYFLACLRNPAPTTRSPGKTNYSGQKKKKSTSEPTPSDGEDEFDFNALLRNAPLEGRGGRR